MGAQVAVRPLNHKQRRFAEEIGNGVDVLEAYQAAGYATQNPTLARANARRLKRDPRVKELVERVAADAIQISGVRLARILFEWDCLAYSNFADFWQAGENGLQMRDLTTLPREMTAAIKSVKFGPLGSVEVKLHDKPGVLRDLARYCGAFANKDEDAAPVPIQLQQLIVQLQGMPAIEAERKIASMVAAASSDAEAPNIASMARSVALMLYNAHQRKLAAVPPETVAAA